MKLLIQNFQPVKLKAKWFRKNMEMIFVTLAFGFIAIFSAEKVSAVNDSIFLRIWHNDSSMFPLNNSNDSFHGTNNAKFDQVLRDHGIIFYSQNLKLLPSWPNYFGLYNSNTDSLTYSLMTALSTFPSIYKIERLYIPQLPNIQVNPTAVNFTIKPNPAKDIILIESNSSNLKRVEIIDLMGKVIFYSDCLAKELQIETANFTPGIYMVSTYTSDKRVTTRKLMISK